VWQAQNGFFVGEPKAIFSVRLSLLTMSSTRSASGRVLSQYFWAFRAVLCYRCCAVLPGWRCAVLCLDLLPQQQCQACY
jgi:hypothetical protein